MLIPVSVISGAAPETLPPVSGYSAWYDSLKTNTLSGQGAVGSGVQVWLDRAGTQNYLVQAAAGSRPTYGTRQMGVFNTLDWDGGDQMGGTFSLGVRPHSALAVVVLDVVDGTNRFVYSASGGNLRIGLYVEATTGEIKTNFANIASVSSGLTLSAGQAYVIGHSMSTTSVLFQRDGTQSNPVADATSATAGTVVVGAFGGGGSVFNGIISELLIWERELTAGEMSSMATFLRAKWGIP